MNGSIHALRRANPRNRPGFARSVEAVEEAVHSRLDGFEDPAPETSFARRRLIRVSSAGAVVAAVAAAALVLIGSPGSGPGVESATAAVRKAATMTAASAERSGTARVRITHNGQAWAAGTVRWNGEDVAISQDLRRRGRAGSELRVVDGVLYGVEPRSAGSTWAPPTTSIPTAARPRPSTSRQRVRTWEA